VISLGGIVSWSSTRVGGNKIDSAIAEYIKKKYNLAIGDRTAEEIKISIGSAIPLSKDKEMAMEIRGRDLIAGMPKAIKIKSNEITEAIVDELREIIHSIKIVLRETPPELSADIMDKGIIISGGGALLRNIDRLICEAIGVPCYIADDPLLCVAKGTGVVLDNLEIYKRSIMSKK
ncbi:MAG: rod shape-determining protein, partial [Patescibacteria group bacterium]